MHALFSRLRTNEHQYTILFNIGHEYASLKERPSILLCRKVVDVLNSIFQLNSSLTIFNSKQLQGHASISFTQKRNGIYPLIFEGGNKIDSRSTSRMAFNSDKPIFSSYLSIALLLIDGIWY